MKTIRSFKGARRGQITILVAMMAVVLILLLMSAYSLASFFRVNLIRSDFEETVLKISKDFHKSAEVSLASASARWSQGCIDHQDVGNDLLLSWAQSVGNTYAGLGVNPSIEPSPVQFMLQRLINTGRSSCTAGLSLEIIEYGFHGWRDVVTVEDLLVIDPLSVKRSGDHVSFSFSFTKEGGQPIPDLSPDNIALHMREEQAIRKLIDPSNILLTHIGGAEYSINVTTQTFEQLTYNIDVLKIIINNMPNDYFKNTSYKSYLISDLTAVQSLIENNAWTEAYQKLANDIRSKLDPTDPQTWMKPNADTKIALMITDESLDYMFPTFELMAFDERGVVTMCYVAFPGSGDTIGPEVEGLTILPSYQATRTFLRPGSISLVALLNDTATGGSDIKAAEYFPDKEGKYGKGNQMTPQDGSFDTPEEWVSATLNITGWEVGDYTFYAHGEDVVGNWGQTRLILLKIRDLIPPSVANVSVYLDRALYPEGYSLEKGSQGAPKLQVNVTGISDLYRGDSIIASVQVRLYNTTFSTGWTSLTAQDGAFDEIDENANGQIGIATLAPGFYTLVVRAADSFGNQGYASITVNVTPDNKGPVLEDIQLSPSMELTAQAREIGNANYMVSVIQYMVSNGTYQSGWRDMNPSDGTYDSRIETAWAIVNVAGLSPGNYTVTVRALDSGGNIGGSVERNFEIM